MPVNHLLIALGGTGGKCLYGVRQMMYQNWERRFEPDTANVRCLWVDSSSIDLNGLHKSFPVLGGSVDLPPADKLKITGTVPISDVLAQPQAFPSIAPWLGDPSNYEGILNVVNAAEMQAAQVRRLGRMLFANKIGLFQEMVTRLIGEMRVAARPGLAQDPATDIHILCGLAGGTGSGSVVDAATTCRALFPGGNVRIFVYAMLPEEHPASGRAGRNYHANGYAALRELNALSVGAWKPHNLADSRGLRHEAMNDPITSCFLFTEQNQSRHLEVDRELPEAVAGFVYQLVSEAQRMQWEGGNNLWQTQLAFQVGGNAQRPETSGGRGNRPARSRRFMSFGIKTIAFPQVEVREHLTYTYCQSAARQMLYNSWNPERGYEEVAVPRGFAVSVRRPEFRAAIKASKQHLTLDLPILPEEEKQNWHTSKSYWDTVGVAFERDAMQRAFPQQMGKLHELFQESFDSKYRDKGVKGFYELMRQRSLRQHAEEIRRRVEAKLKEQWAQGDHGMYDLEQLLKELISAMDDWRAEHQNAAEQMNEAGKPVSELNSAIGENNKRYAQCGVIARTAGTHSRLINGNRLHDQEKFDSLTAAEGHRYAADLLPQVSVQLSKLLDDITAARTDMEEALEVFTGGRTQRCREEDANRFDQQVVRCYHPKQARDMANDLYRDDQEQRRQTASLRAVLQEKLGPEWAFASWSELRGAELRQLFEDTCDGAARAGHNALVDRERGRRPVLQANILTELQQSMGGKDEELAAFSRLAISGAQNLLVLDDNQVSRQVSGGLAAQNRQNAIGYTSTVITLPQAADSGFRQKLAVQLKGEVGSVAVGAVALAQNAGRPHEITITRITSVMPARFGARVALLRTAYERLVSEEGERKLTELHIEPALESLPDLYAQEYTVAAMLPWLLLARSIRIGEDQVGPLYMVDSRPNPATKRNVFYHWARGAYDDLTAIREFGPSEDDVLARAGIEDLENIKDGVLQELDTRLAGVLEREALFAVVMVNYQRRTEGLMANDERVVNLRAARDFIAHLLQIEVKAFHAQTTVSL